MTNTPARISSLAEAIMQMAEHDKGVIKSKLEELIFQHCAAAEASDGMKIQSELLVALHKAEIKSHFIKRRRVELEDWVKWSEWSKMQRLTDP